MRNIASSDTARTATGVAILMFFVVIGLLEFGLLLLMAPFVIGICVIQSTQARLAGPAKHPAVPQHADTTYSGPVIQGDYVVLE
jgi:hypothetical protein